MYRSYIVCVSSTETLEMANFPHGQSMQKNMYYSALYFIRNIWPLTSPPSFLFPPPISMCPTTRIHFPKHIITCALVHISSWDSDRCVISFTTECSHMDKRALVWVHFLMLELIILCVCVFWMRTWLRLCKIMAFLCRVLQQKSSNEQHF